MSEVVSPEEAKKAANRERMAKAREARKSNAPVDKDSIVKEVTAGVLGALKEAGVFAVNPATRPAMARTNPGTPPPVAATVGYRCKCGLIHTPDMHYGVEIQPGMHYCNVEDFPDSVGIPSDIQRLQSIGFEVAKKTSERHCVMMAPEAIAMKHRDEAAMASRARVRRRTTPEADAAAAIQRGQQEAQFDEIKSGTPIHVDLSRGPVGDIDDVGISDTPDY